MNQSLKSVTGHGHDGHLLALNSGSSSLKFGLYRGHKERITCILNGAAEMLGEPTCFIHAEDARGRTMHRESASMADQGAIVMRIGRMLDDSKAPSPQAIGHRIVHGGPHVRDHVLIDKSVLEQLDAATAFAPLHMPAAMTAIRFAQAHFPGLPQVACLDTCFHAGMPPVARTLPLPRDIRAAGIQRYGFHGLSCESIVRQLAGALPERLLIAHLGNGASITAVLKGKSIDTSMGLTPTGGVIMGTRSGDLDPGALVHLMREMKLDATALEELVDHRSGLLGLSAVSGDMRVLHQAAPSNGDARLAIEMFAYVAAKELGAMSTVLGGVDMIVFTGGIGEHDAAVRADICARLSCLGVELDADRNRRGDGSISRDSSRCKVHVLPSEEDEQIARHTWALCGLQT